MVRGGSPAGPFAEAIDRVFCTPCPLPFDPEAWIRTGSDVVTSHTPTHEASLWAVFSIVGGSIVSRRRSTSYVEAHGARRMVVATNPGANLTLGRGLMMVC